MRLWRSGFKSFAFPRQNAWRRPVPGRPVPGASPSTSCRRQGGGIRAAYWTAIVLASSAACRTSSTGRFHSRASVGSLGEAVWYACLDGVPWGDANDAADRIHACVHPLGSTDLLLTPLLSAMLFEDVLARFVPSRWCEAPGCGFLDRGSWFESDVLNGRDLVALVIDRGTWESARPLPASIPEQHLGRDRGACDCERRHDTLARLPHGARSIGQGRRGLAAQHGCAQFRAVPVRQRVGSGSSLDISPNRGWTRKCSECATPYDRSCTRRPTTSCRLAC